MSRRSSPVQSSGLSIQRTGEEQLTRSDLQYDLLSHIFNDNHPVFTDPFPSLSGHSAFTRVCFRDLYINAIIHSSKATKALKDKMLDNPIFATDFAMLSLLVNVGRINSTMSFFPEMKTTVRTYHPVPALQRTNGNLQDAPRIKLILKSSLLEEELDSVPSNPTDILARARSGQIPSTNIANLIFVLTNHATHLAQAHFANNFDFLDLFLPVAVSSASRARAFLWLCYHYLEAPSGTDDDYDGDSGIPNPFSDPRRNSGRIPALVMLTPTEAAEENVDTEDEKNLAEKLLAQRNAIVLKNHVAKEATKASQAKGYASTLGEDDDGAASGGELRPKIEPIAARNITAKEKKAASDKLRRERLKAKARERQLFTSAQTPGCTDNDLPPQQSVLFAQNQYPQHQHHYQPQPPLQKAHLGHQTRPTYRVISSRTTDPPVVHSHRHAPYKLSPIATTSHASKRDHKSHPRSTRTHFIPRRTMLQHAWHVITTSDPLVDSDEDIADEHVRRDYVQRLEIISRLRGKELTPEPE